MPRLDSGFIVLEDNFYEVMKGSSYYRGAKNCRDRKRKILDGVRLENTRDVVIVSKLQWGCGVDIGDTINSIS